MKSQNLSEELFMQLSEDMMEDLGKEELIWIKGGNKIPTTPENNGVGCGCSGDPKNNGVGCGCS